MRHKIAAKLYLDTLRAAKKAEIHTARNGTATRAARRVALPFHPVSARAALAMTDAKRNWIEWLMFSALCVSAEAATFAQSVPPDPFSSNLVEVQSPQSGSLVGRLTDLHSAPLGGVSIVLCNQSTGAQVRATTAKNGSFRIPSLDAGEYSLDADAIQLGHGRLDGILVTGGVESHVQAAMLFEPVSPALIEANAPNHAVSSAADATPLPLNLPMPPVSTRSLGPNLAALASAAPPAWPRPALRTLNPKLIAYIIDEPLSLLPLAALNAPDAARIPVQTATSTRVALPLAPPPAAAIVASLSATPASTALQRTQSPVHLSGLPPRARLETQSAAIELGLAIESPHAFSLRTGTAPDFAAASVPPILAQAAMLNPPPAASIVAAAQPSEPVASVVSTTISASQMQALPAIGRRWQQFLLDTPAAGASADLSQVSFRGSQQSAGATIDGANIGLAFGVSAGSGVRTPNPASGDPDPETSTPQSESHGWAGGRALGLSEAAVHEVTIAAGNAEADAMRSAGGRTTIRTESGTNALHGQGFLFDRQNTWGAQNPFTQWVRNTGSADAPDFTAVPFTPPDHETVWGIGVGSDIRRNRLFWFAALDSNHRNDPGLSSVKNPTEFFAPTEPTSASITLLSAQLGESQNQAYYDYLGIPGAGYAPAGLEQLAELLGPAPRTSAQWLGFGRVDWQSTERQHFTLEGTGANWNAPGGGLTRVSETYGSHSYGSSQANQEWMLARWEAYLTPNLLAVTQGSVGRAIFSARPDGPSTFEQSFLSGNSWNQLPQIVVDSRYGFTIGNPSRFGQGSYPDEHYFHGQEVFDWVHNKLLVRAGFELDHDADAVSQLRNQTGTYFYSNVASFISDALAFQKFGFIDALDPSNPHNCGVTDTRFGSQPCYSYYSQTMGPTDWHLSTNDWAGYTTAQWQLSKLAVFSAGLRWEREQMPPPIASLANPELTTATEADPQPPLSANLPVLGNDWGPRVSLAVGNIDDRWPVLRLGYGMYYGRTENATIETALTETGSLNGDLNFFMRPSDDCQHCSGGAPPFPYVLSGAPTSLVAPGALGFASRFRSPEVHQAVAAVEQMLPSHVELTAGAMVSLARRLPISVDTNFNPAVNPSTITYGVNDPTGTGPIKAAQITVPFYAAWPFEECPAGSPLNSGSQCGRRYGNYQQIAQITSRANSTYEAATVKIARFSRRGLSFDVNYTYSHAMDWNPNETTLVASSDVLDPAHFDQEYGTSDLDVRHSAAFTAVLEAPWKLHGAAGRFGNGWALSGVGQFRSGLPFTMRTSGSLPEEFDTTGNAITGLGPGMNGSGGDNRVYGLGSDGRSYNIGRNTFRYPNTWKADLRLTKHFDIGETRQLELIAETFNFFNHQNVTALETTGYSIENSGTPGTLPTLCYLTINTEGSASCGTTPVAGAATPIAAFGQPLDINAIDFYRERQIEIGLRMRF